MRVVSARFIPVALFLAVACGATAGGPPDGPVADAPDVPIADPGPTDVTDEVATDSGDADTTATADADPGPVACGSHAYAWRALVPGPGEPGFDADLEAKATTYERVWQAFNADAMHLNTDVSVALASDADRKLVEAFAAKADAWDFAAFAGKPASAVVTAQHKVAGLYAGDGVAADAYRYMVLRDQGYPCDDVARARAWLAADLDWLHTAVAITGAPGVICRGLQRIDLPSADAVETLDLFDAQGKPQPEPKSNGTWRADLSGGLYPDLAWEDSVSRDQYIGWVAAYASAWEALRDDPDFPQAAKDRLRADALAVARRLKEVRPSGYDLEIPDADGRTTLHGWLNERNFDGVAYIDGYENGFHAAMALGIVAAWVFVTDDPELSAWLDDRLIGERRLHEIARDRVADLVDMGVVSNYSNYNMAFQGFWLALRYLRHEGARAALRAAVGANLYDRPGQDRQPADFGYSLYDFVYAHGAAGGSAYGPAVTPLDEAAVARGIASLAGFRPAPYWDRGVALCPDAVCTEEAPQVADPDCLAPDGTTHFTLLGCVGRNGDLVAAEPIPMSLIGPSNFRWRSNPYMPNFGGDGSTLLPGVDFRIAYWMGRVFRRGAE